MPSAPPAPPARTRAGGAPPITSEKFARYETIETTIAAGTDFLEQGRFSGTPDAIDIWCSAAGMQVQLADLAVNEVSSFNTEANATLSTYVSRRLVLARDPAGTGGQLLRVTGKWAELNR